MAPINLILSKLKPLGLVCFGLLVFHLMLFQIVGLYDNFGFGSTAVVEDSDAFEAVLSNSATSDSYKAVTSSDMQSNISFPTSSAGNFSTFLEDVQILSEEPMKPLCNQTPSGLVGPIRVFLDEPSFETMEKMFPQLHAGGHGKPEECSARHRVAVIVPFRDRESHLRILLHNLHSLLLKQQLDYAIFVVEQVANQTFNRGKLMNVGYDVASKMYPWQCFIFHDVDLLPEDDRNLYTCPIQPRHMSVAVDKFHYKLPYSAIFGGISALTKEQYEKMNGFSNDYWGWGGEDDDLSTRATSVGYKVSRYPAQIARYKMIKHSQEKTNPVNKCRYKIMKRTQDRYQKDGYKSLDYKLLKLDLNTMYTRIHVDLLEKQSRMKLRRTFPTCY